ncbi:hypothetical protein CkaCkLH20_06937 [Colletotrichum karsti]|uniref:Uncharacterized protein n=1 Tax=Colletotrichum karsti TaxID=1095194 RepID=A0A9P6I7T3_9PEZI|nr:uncharacterized protein CkaCkLH20_06937 [Colletotrichum karsti]KAF9875556.1 hypothetical protein CkaCkLH20_06937 [Colletotrichum karsti]
MSSFNKFLFTSVLVATSITAAVLPTNDIQVSSNLEAPTTITTRSSPVPSIDCDHSWCQDGKSMCAYWAGVTGYDPSLGPIPGETVTQLGSCATPTTTTESLEPRKVQDDNEILITPAPTTSVNCLYNYCESSTSYCMYWAGITGYDISLGPIPGMQRTTLGSCQAPASVGTDGVAHFSATPTTMSTVAKETKSLESF